MNLERIDEIIAKNINITDKSLYEGVFNAVLDAVNEENEACLALVNQGTGEATSADALKILRMERNLISAAIRARGEA